MEKSLILGWLKSSTENEANLLVSQINECLGIPRPNCETLTWDIPTCLQNDYSPYDTENGWFVVIMDECYDCLTQEQKDQILTSLPYEISCGTPEPNPSGSTENYL